MEQFDSMRVRVRIATTRLLLLDRHPKVREEAERFAHQLSTLLGNDQVEHMQKAHGALQAGFRSLVKELPDYEHDPGLIVTVSRRRRHP